ncbi:MAG: hypothetical protein HS129_15020 [Leptospiraceae bacterium]|nr:hypothetical protein [Leptospiraceae bacterium]
MLLLDQELKIGEFKIPIVREVILETSREIPTDTLVVKLPKYKNLKKDDIKPDDKVTWKAGYTQYGLFPEFSGYVREVSPTIPFEIKCVDPMHYCQLQTMKRNYNNHPLAGFLQDCLHSKIKKDITLKIDPEAPKTISINNCANKSGRFALWELSAKYGLDVFFRDWKLCVQKAFVKRNAFTQEKDKKVTKSKAASGTESGSSKDIPVFQFKYNIIEDSLIPRLKKDFIIIVRGENPKTGTQYSGQFGIKGEKKYYEIDGLDKKQATSRAKELFAEQCGSGFNGKFTTFGFPSVQHSQIIEILDLEDTSRSAKTFVNKIIKNFDGGNAKYRQEIFPGYFYEEPKKKPESPPQKQEGRLIRS